MLYCGLALDIQWDDTVTVGFIANLLLFLMLI